MIGFTGTIAARIEELKRLRQAIVLAHHYQDEEVQEVADHVGDSLELAHLAQNFQGDVIAFCGAKFMAEMAKVLNPKRTVVIPDLRAGCSLVDSCPAQAVRAFRKRNPRHAIVSYLNTSVEVKAESDILCTAGNAVAIVNSIPQSQPVLFLPDINLGNWVQRQTGRQNMQIWQGACIVHATFAGRKLTAAKLQHPQALVAAHPGSPGEVLRMADFVGSTSQIVAWCSKQSASEFILLTESGIRQTLQKTAPGKSFHFVVSESCNCSECPYMRMNTLEKLADCLETLTPRIEIAEELAVRARIPLERMLQVK